MAVKNLKAKSVKKENAYEVYVTRDLSWVWYVLKHWASEEKEASDPYARVFCHVFSPMTGSFGDMGDTYLREIKSQAVDAREALKTTEKNLADWEASPELGHGRIQSIIALKARRDRLNAIIAGNY